MVVRAPDGSGAEGWAEPSHCRFELSPPRHFVYPAILLLLSEKPRHGYRLVDPIMGLGFGPVDRPTVYRALADLERDGLLESWNAEPQAGATRHVYAVTDAGRRALGRWMDVLIAEREELDRVVQRYVLLDHHPRAFPAPAAARPPWPARAIVVAEEGRRSYGAVDAHEGTGVAPAIGSPARFEVVPGQSAIMIRARSNVGTIEFGTTGVRGQVEVALHDGAPVPAAGVSARLEVDVGTLTSGNSLYDAELMHRVHARSYPVAVVELDGAEPLGSEDRFEIAGRLTFHGVTAAVSGAVGVTLLSDQRLVVSGEKVIDIRDFEIAAPAMLMLKIYPDVRVFLHLEANATGGVRPGDG